MKKHFQAILLFGLVNLLTPEIRAQDEEKIQKLFQDAIQAMGGETFLKVTDMVSEGNYFGFNREGDHTGLIKYQSYWTPCISTSR